jgi:abortive infection bacteriophage resistance protein
MQYEYKKLTIKSYIESLYGDGLKTSDKLNEQEIHEVISHIGIFKVKGYVKAFRDKLDLYSIDEVLELYTIDRQLSIKLLDYTAQIEIKLKTYLIETVYELTDNPFCYLLKASYKEDFNLPNDSLYTWEEKENRGKKELYSHYRDYYLEKYDFKSNKNTYLKDKELLRLNTQKSINYPPFHYFIESATLGTTIAFVSQMKINEQDILRLVANKFGIFNQKVFMSYLLRFKELRNRCAHNGRIFNRNYRSVKAISIYRTIRKDIYDHRLLDVYYTLHFLLGKSSEFKNSIDLENKFIEENLKDTSTKMRELILNCMRYKR